MYQPYLHQSFYRSPKRGGVGGMEGGPVNPGGSGFINNVQSHPAARSFYSNILFLKGKLEARRFK